MLFFPAALVVMVFAGAVVFFTVAGPPGNAGEGQAPGDLLNLSEKRELGGEPVDVLILGVDKRPEGEEPEAMGVRADAIMVARVMPESGEVRLLSIPRDLFVEVAPGETDRINASYATGGVDRTIAVVEHYTGLSIEHHAVADFQGFEDIVDAAGGVKLDVQGEYPPGYHIEEGQQRLNGRQALLYARYRDTPGGDLDRIDHQQQVVAALREEALGWDSVAKMPGVAKAVVENVETDVGMDEGMAFARALVDKASGGETEITTYKLEGTPETLDDGREVLIPDDEKNRALVSQFLD